MAAASVRAQAKINLFLRVTGREPSGYHTLETLFCRIDLADLVQVRLTRSSRSLDCAGPELPADGLGHVEDNLAWRAAVAYADVARWRIGFEIALEKNIPVGAGLGGGSADAGAVLRALNALRPRPMAPNEIVEIARTLGADVPFLTQDQTPLALGFGRGDRWQSLDPLPDTSCIVAMPAARVATAQAYAWLDADRSWANREVTSARQPAPRASDWDQIREFAHNDFETVVMPRVAEIAAARRYLDQIAAPRGFALLCGSGAAVFAIPQSESPQAAHAEAPSGVRITATRTAKRVESVQPTD